jgi:signal transduction histidine kinase
MTPEAIASVLIVDDTIDNLRFLSDLLCGQGYDVRAVTSGRQALQSVEHELPDLILLDITMPDMDGYEVCRRLRAMECSKDVPVIFLTALTETSDKVRAFDAGAVDYVTKPFQFDEVLARVRTHVALRHARIALGDSYERLRALEQLRDDLVHMIVHDMRSPLSALQLSLEVLQQRVTTVDEASSRGLDAAVESSRVLERMANELLDVSRLEDGKMPIEPAAWNLTQMARDVCASLHALDRQRTIEIDAAQPVHATCDGGLVRRVLENLVSNAIKHTPPGSPIGISIAGRGDRVRIAVHDEGSGVPPEAREKIFRKFGTVEARHQRTYHSVGLGLAFCKLAIEAQGGTIGVDPRVPGGSTFWFELPA